MKPTEIMLFHTITARLFGYNFPAEASYIMIAVWLHDKAYNEIHIQSVG